jgi:hypothetical protein
MEHVAAPTYVIGRDFSDLHGNFLAMAVTLIERHGRQLNKRVLLMCS